MSEKFISIKNARVHNLKGVSVDIPKNKLTVITGLSGSGKSSLAFDTIYAEGQRRYAESLSAYARQFMDIQDKPDVEEITGLSPTIAIEQKNTSQNPRSTVGTTTEIYDYLRLLFARFGTQFDPETNAPVLQYTNGEITERIRKMLANGSEELHIIAPLTREEAEAKPKQIIAAIERSGFHYTRLNGILMKTSDLKKYKFDAGKEYEIDAVVGTVTEESKKEILDFVEKAVDLSNGFVIVLDEDGGEEEMFSTVPYSESSGKVFDPVEPRSFSFNSPYGACSRCTGLGYTLDVDTELVIPNPRLTLAEGAIQPWTRIVGNQSYYQDLLKAVSLVKGFSVDEPVDSLPSSVMEIIFYGTGNDEYIVGGKKTIFEGVVPNLVNRHSKTDSEYIRKEIEQYMIEKECPVCNGKRLKKESLNVKIGELSIADIVALSIEEANYIFTEAKGACEVTSPLSKEKQTLAAALCKEIQVRLENMVNVGISYLTLNRSVNTLSGGEAQRIRLSTQLSTGLTDVIYILDEPSIGLHSRDNLRLIETLKSLRDLGNTVIVVEHDQDMMEAADYVIDIGPGAGEKGGEIVSHGTAEQIKADSKSLTGQYISGKTKIDPPKKYRKGNGKSIKIIGASGFNLKNIDVEFPLGKFLCVTGVSGSGKSTVVIDILSKALSKKFYRSKAQPGRHKDIKGISNIDKVISIDQTPIGRTPRSNPATYTGVFTAIRELFASLPEAKMQGFSAGMFSFNVKGGGRCEACTGEGYIRIPMQFLADVFVECSECSGKRYNKAALDIHYRGKNIADVLDMTVEEGFRFFNDVTAIAEKLKILREVGLGYLRLGQPATTVSGGEAQRIKLATELSRRSTGKTLYILDEPTTGLHFEDIKKLLHVLSKLVDKGNTVITIEHNLDVIKCADWIIDMGPDGGNKGGEVVASGTPKDVMKVKESLTGKYLKEIS